MAITNNEPVDIIETMQESIRLLKKYPGEVEELAYQLHNITKAAQQLAAHYNMPVSDGVVDQP